MAASSSSYTGDEAGSSSWSRPLAIGWREHVDFLDWGVPHVKVKVDTGARTSALDVASYELRPTDSGVMVVELHLALYRGKRPRRTVVVQAPVLRMVSVCNSIGMRQERPLIETRIRLGPICKSVRLTITNRSRMRFPMILGRTALAGDFIVDVSQKNLLDRFRSPRRPGPAS